MKSTIGVALLLLLLCFLCPLLFLSASLQQPLPSVTPSPSPSLSLSEQSVTEEQTELPSSSDAQVQVKVQGSDGTISTLSMADYLWGVVAAEMPASFASDALSAQATTARTYTLHKMEIGPVSSHPEADICTDSSCCQAYVTPTQATASWGEDALLYTEKIQEAVSATDGQVLLYQGEPIDAVFFSSVAGSTLDAVEVWGTAVPYLTAVDSPETSEEVPDYDTEQSVPLDQFQQAIETAYPEADLSAPYYQWISATLYSSNGGIAQMELGGITLTGSQIRSLFSLRSTHFTLRFTEDMATFSVTGYGHGVGMSQYGANLLAQEGYSWQEILDWYYQDVTLGSYQSF